VVERADDELVVRLLEPRAAVTPGQSAVLFAGDRVLGGGRIVRAASLATY
jgi:tRNA U34 2-thiouridine synthase MnmA/TrmU